ncbi:MAG TPA: hypothetical protein VHG92_10350 [Afifellaceae bacterium]|nr:hypothetical protein [Afifellaceae bacterium]
MDRQDRERAMEELAAQLLFRLERHGSHYSLCREADVSAPVRHDGLTLEEAEELLNTWKMRGFHGG